MLKSKDMIGIWNMLEFSPDHNPTLSEKVLEEEPDESWWEENKGAVYVYGALAGLTIFIIIPWFTGIVMWIKWLFF